MVIGEIPITLIEDAVYPAAEEEMKLDIKEVWLNNAPILCWTDIYTAFVFS